MGLFSSPIEKQLEDYYVRMFADMNISSQTVKEIIKKAKQNIKKNGEDKFPPNIAEEIISDPKMKPALEKRRKEGVKDEDIRWWWGLQALERQIMLEVDNFHRTALYMTEWQDTGSFEEAAKMVFKYHPTYGDPTDTSHNKGEDRPIPVELKDRINKYIEKRTISDPEQYKKDIETSTSFNALIRREIKTNNL